MKVKTSEQSPVAVLYRAAKAIVDGTRQVFADNGKDASELRLPILMHGTDMRVTIEAGPRVAARNAIEEAQSKASGKPAPTPDATKALRDSQILLMQYAAHLRGQCTSGLGEWLPECSHERDTHERCLATVATMSEVERLL